MIFKNIKYIINIKTYNSMEAWHVWLILCQSSTQLWINFTHIIQEFKQPAPLGWIKGLQILQLVTQLHPHNECSYKPKSKKMGALLLHPVSLWSYNGRDGSNSPKGKAKDITLFIHSFIWLLKLLILKSPWYLMSGYVAERRQRWIG